MLAAAAKIATAAVSPIVRQLNFGIWRHRKILCVLAHIRLPLVPIPNVESRLHATIEEYPWGYFQFSLIFGYAKTPLFGNPISAPHVVDWGPHILMRMMSPDLVSSPALRYESEVLPPVP